MIKKILLIVCFIITTFSIGQVKINVGIYSDSTLTKPLSNVKIIIKSGSKTKTFKTDRNGKINIAPKFINTKYSIKIVKKDYNSISLSAISDNITFDVILKKQLSIHDEDYNGTSKIIIRN
jgi:hypothetical protein